MLPTVAIVEPHDEIAVALGEVAALARCHPVRVDDVAALVELASPLAAIVLRMHATVSDHASTKTLREFNQPARPQVLALASSDADVEEARRLGCDVVLREPQQVRALYEALKRVADQQRAASA